MSARFSATPRVSRVTIPGVRNVASILANARRAVLSGTTRVARRMVVARSIVIACVAPAVCLWSPRLAASAPPSPASPVVKPAAPPSPVKTPTAPPASEKPKPAPAQPQDEPGLLEQLFGGKRSKSPSTKDEEVWAIRCITFRGADQMIRAERAAAALQQVSGLARDRVQVLADDDGAAVYYGRYKRVYAAGETESQYSPDAKKDLDLIRSLQVQGGGQWPFAMAAIDVLPTYRTPKPEWDLNNVNGFWSLHVAVFYNTDTLASRRSAAEEYCRILREQGEDAYFHHGVSNSSVYIGAFAPGAVVEAKKEDALAGRTSTVYRVVEPRLLEAQKRFPYSLHNGHMMYELVRSSPSGEVSRRIPLESFVVKTPKARDAEASRARRQ